MDFSRCFPMLPLTRSSTPNRTMTTRRHYTVPPSTATPGWCGCCWRSWQTPPWGTTSLRLRSTWPPYTAAWRLSSCCSLPTPTCSAATPRNTRRCIWPLATDTCLWWRCCWTPAWTSTTRCVIHPYICENLKSFSFQAFLNILSWPKSCWVT